MDRLQKIGWGLSWLISLFLVFGSAIGKFIEWEGKQELFDKLGYSADQLFYVGILEIVIAVLILMPKVDWLGMLLLTALLGGATSTHYRIDDPVIFPVAMGCIAWLGYLMRKPELRKVIC